MESKEAVLKKYQTRLVQAMSGMAFIAFVFYAWSVNKAVVRDERARMASYRADWDACVRGLSKLHRLPIKGGEEFIERTRLIGLHSNIEFDGRVCEIDMISGTFYWDGKQTLPRAIAQSNAEPTFQVVALLNSASSHCHEKDQCGSRNIESRPIMASSDFLRVKLKNYPDYELRLKYPPPDSRNRNSLRFLILSSSNAHPPQRLVQCDSFFRMPGGHGTPLVDTLVGMTLSELEDIDFGGLRQSCEIDFEDTQLKSGSVRVNFYANDLNVVEKAMLSIESYFNNSIQ
jgi:hypothetical protein